MAETNFTRLPSSKASAELRNKKARQQQICTRWRETVLCAIAIGLLFVRLLFWIFIAGGQ